QYNKPQQKAGANTSIILGHFQKRLTKIFILLFEVLTYPIHAGSSSEYPIFNSMYIKLLIILILS
ncbi:MULTISPECIES: hypothetical protein, partial [unclassified Ruminococcus]